MGLANIHVYEVASFNANNAGDQLTKANISSTIY